MSNLQDYGKISVYGNGKQWMEEASVDIKPSGGAKPIHTVMKGLAGFSQGSPFIETDVKVAIPAAGFEFNPMPYIKNRTVIAMSFVAAMQTMTTNQVILSAKISHGVDGEATLEMSMMGQYADFE